MSVSCIFRTPLCPSRECVRSLADNSNATRVHTCNYRASTRYCDHLQSSSARRANSGLWPSASPLLLTPASRGQTPSISYGERIGSAQCPSRSRQRIRLGQTEQKPTTKTNLGSKPSLTDSDCWSCSSMLDSGKALPSRTRGMFLLVGSSSNDAISHGQEDRSSDD
ncbi:hypothetical protein Micbo1qcDRAFT_61205 [Microdochium bolleyi]|uniref:Uncharacterized protein n=1 Tax=Microdochium bolleyi TaxID=196109 RepID=A0A136J538_9PEZI|nr:hypothetical protein Micbo1qcDRAFT_61205 [Microdochium bolleyi]